MKEQLLPVGTKVFDIQYGWGEIKKIEDMDYCYNVLFDKDVSNCFTKLGKFAEYDINPTLSLTEYTLENGGFTPLSDYNKPKLGDIGYFWDDNDVEIAGRVIYSKITKINKSYFFDSQMIGWGNFSKEIPEWFKNKMNEENID
jgi:hypothetical protein